MYLNKQTKTWRCYVRKNEIEKKAEAKRRDTPEKVARLKKRTRRRSLERMYGLSVQEYEALYQYQGGACAICGSRLRLWPDDEGKLIAVDHDHKSGLIRGLLCSMPCNHILGHWHDKSENLRAAADYLVTPPARFVLGERVVPERPKKNRRKKYKS